MSKGEKIYLCLSYTIWMSFGIAIQIVAITYLSHHKPWLVVGMIAYAVIAFIAKWRKLSAEENNTYNKWIKKWKNQ